MSNNAEARKFCSEGVAHYSNKKYDEAIKDYSEAIELDRSYTDAYNYRGIAYHKKGDYDEAIKDYSEAIKLNPNDAVAYYNRGNAYDNKGDYDEAIKDYSEAIKLNPKYADAYINRGNAYHNKGDYNTAIKDYSEAIKIDPKYADAYNNRGVAYGKKGDYDKAIKDYDKSIELNPNNSYAYNNKGDSLYELGNYEDAIKCCDSAIELDSQNGAAYINKGKVLAKQGKDKEAIKCWDKVPQGDKEYHKARVFMAIHDEDSLIKSKFSEIDKSYKETQTLHKEIKEVAYKVSESYENMVKQLVFKDFKEKADTLESDRKWCSKMFVIMVIIDIVVMMSCFAFNIWVLPNLTNNEGQNFWQYLGQSLALTSPIFIVLLWFTKYFNRRSHELMHLKEEYEYKFLTMLVFDGFKDTVDKYGKENTAEYITKVINTITENPTYSLDRKKTDKIPINPIK